MPTVTDLEAIPVNVDVTPLSEGGIAPYVSNHGYVEDRDRVLLRVETDTGVTGWGELLATYASPEATKAVYEHVVAPELVGRSLDEIRDFVESFYYPYVRIDPFLGGIEMALWDALGKHLGAPLHQLLGGKMQEEIPVAFCLGILEPEEAAEHAACARGMGFETIKTKAGSNPEADVERLLAMHEAVDGELDFRLDPNQAWSFEEAIRATNTIEEAGVPMEYLEQPCRVETYGSYAQLRSRTRMPIAVNEDTYFRYHLHHLVKEDAIDAAVVDIVPGGGILRTKELAGLAEQAGVSVAHHSGFDLGIKTAAVLHTVATTPAIDLAADSTYYAWEEHLTEEQLRVEDGSIAVPDDPGLGIEIDEDAVDEHRIDI